MVPELKRKDLVAFAKANKGDFERLLKEFVRVNSCCGPSAALLIDPFVEVV